MRYVPDFKAPIPVPGEPLEGGSWDNTVRTPPYETSSTVTDGRATPSSSTTIGNRGRPPPSLRSVSIHSNYSNDVHTLHARDFSVKYWHGEDGRANMEVLRQSASLDDRVLSEDKEPARSQLPQDELPPAYSESASGDPPVKSSGPFMNVVMQVAGSRVEVSYFIAVARRLQIAHGHRVRIATHPEFRREVELAGVEFFDINVPSTAFSVFLGEDDSEPQSPSLSRESVSSTRQLVPRLLKACWQSCVAPSKNGRAFGADAIIANPQSCAHMHCAEKLGVPLHFMSTTPWTRSREIPHPYVNVVSSEIGPQLTNRLTFAIAEIMLWSFFGKGINEFRSKDLGLHPMQLAFAPGLLQRLKCPMTYFRSSKSIPRRPRDWPRNVFFYEPSSQSTAEERREGEIAYATQSFLKELRLEDMRCGLLTQKIAVFKVRGLRLQLSPVVAAVLRRKNLLGADDVALCRYREYDLEDRPFDPTTSLAANTSDTLASVLLGITAGSLEGHKQVQGNMGHRQGSPSKTTLRSGEKYEGEGAPFVSVAVDTAKGFGDIAAAGLKMPMAITHGLAKGFHNVPRLYGDATVRDPDKITGVKSGMTAAGKGLAFGIYDGISGIFVQPYQGAKEGGAQGFAEGAKGFAKGFGKGLGGAIFKPAAGICGVAGYPFMGIYKEMLRLGKTSAADYALAARLAQGEDDFALLDDRQIKAVVDAWKSIRSA